MQLNNNQIKLSLEQKVKERTLSLEVANQNLKSLNFIASHDLQEPLRKIRTFIALLQDKQMNSESSRLYLEKIDAAAMLTKLWKVIALNILPHECVRYQVQAIQFVPVALGTKY